MTPTLDEWRNIMANKHRNLTDEPIGTTTTTQRRHSANLSAHHTDPDTHRTHQLETLIERRTNALVECDGDDGPRLAFRWSFDSGVECRFGEVNRLAEPHDEIRRTDMPWGRQAIDAALPRTSTWPPYTWDLTDPLERTEAINWVHQLINNID